MCMVDISPYSLPRVARIVNESFGDGSQVASKMVTVPVDTSNDSDSSLPSSLSSPKIVTGGFRRFRQITPV